MSEIQRTCQHDVRSIQLAKVALYAVAQLLMRRSQRRHAAQAQGLKSPANG